ncbi:sensor histidine kinase [Sphingorhabdus sp.]|uniref:sensor histidine kinase n=1 Tax=Sphingorhabdus sp. TaxID=1902408 RepID=UPI0038FC8DA5
MTSNADLVTIASMFQYFLMGELLIFSICLLVIQIRTRAVYIWQFSNAVALLGNLFLMQVIGAFEGTTSPLGEALIVLALAIKALSFADRGLTQKSNRIASIFLIIGLVPIVIGFVLEETNFRLMLISISGIFLSLSAIFYLIRNKYWIGLSSLKYCVSVLFVYCVIYIFTLSTAYPIGSRTRFIPVDGVIPYTVIIVAVLVFFFHMTFIGLIIGRQARENNFTSRKSLRIQQASNQAKTNEKASAALAEERYHLLKMLTHEVRQPLNTAQATLDTISQQLRRGQTEPENIQQTLLKAQSTINAIVLSISNSILGATLITQGRPSQLHSVDVCDVCQLALFDLDPSQRGRIQQKFEQPVIYADADPIILRLAIRNLLENALKYSPSGTPILFEMVTDEEKLALVIRVTNTRNEKSTLSADIFERNKRGVDRLYEGSGLGLYIVRAVAELHHGDVSYHLVHGNQVAFELSIPA